MMRKLYWNLRHVHTQSAVWMLLYGGVVFLIGSTVSNYNFFGDHHTDDKGIPHILVSKDSSKTIDKRNFADEKIDPVENRQANRHLNEVHAFTNGESDQTKKVEKPIKQLPNEVAVGQQIHINAVQQQPRPAPAAPAVVAGNFVPPRRIVHFDLKGGAPKAEYLQQVFPLLAQLGATGVLIEWEDMFPFKGILAGVRNGFAYTDEQIDAILSAARDAKLDVIPLVQTFGHLEYILKLPQFAHLRDGQQFSQVICFGKEETWNLIKDAIDQVASVHAKYGLPFFHIGADEVFTVGQCPEDADLLGKEGGKHNVILWHIARTAKYVRTKYAGVSVLAWHDMFAHLGEGLLQRYAIADLIEPAVWSYAEDLDRFLPSSTWTALRGFPYVWGASAYKGADGPARFYSNPPHYIQNHYAWIKQMNRNYRAFKEFRGIILTGWSRYDHFAVLCELFPVGFPSLAMNLRIMTDAKERRDFPELQQSIGCSMKNELGPFSGCNFPGVRIYEIIHNIKRMQNQLHSPNGLLQKHEFGGWIGRTNERFLFSSNWALRSLAGDIRAVLAPMEQALADLRRQMLSVFFEDTVEEFIYEYLDADVELLRSRQRALTAIQNKSSFARRPFPELLKAGTPNDVNKKPA